MPIDVGKMPRIYTTMEMAPPGILGGKVPTDRSPEIKLHLKGDNDEIAAFMTEADIGNFELSLELAWAPFMRMIAKICHAYAVSIVGLGGVNFFLPPLIRGEIDYLSHFVGGVSSDVDKLEPPNDLSLIIQDIRGEAHLIGRTTIFGNGRFPTYQAVVGKVLDLDSILAKNTAAQHA